MKNLPFLSLRMLWKSQSFFAVVRSVLQARKLKQSGEKKKENVRHKQNEAISDGKFHCASDVNWFSACDLIKSRDKRRNLFKCSSFRERSLGSNENSVHPSRWTEQPLSVVSSLQMGLMIRLCSL